MRGGNIDISITRFTKQIVRSSRLHRFLTLNILCRAVFDGGVRGFDSLPPQEVVDPQKVLQNLFGGGSTLTSLTTPRFNFLAKPVYLCKLYAAYQSGNLHARDSRSVSHSQSKL